MTGSTGEGRGLPGRPLDGVRVLELGHIIAGPFCTLVLADLGAEVIKIENPDGGDSVRDSSTSGTSAFAAVNRNKKSVTLDLKSDAGSGAFQRLVADADVVVENYADGAPERLGVDAGTCRETNPELVYCSIKGFGEGPYQQYPALDPVAEAMSGLMSVTGRPDSPPARVGASVADMTTSLYGALAVVGALQHRERTGEGQSIRVPLFESATTLMGYWLAYTDASGETPGPQGASHPNWSPYDVFRTVDDEWTFVGPNSERQWRALAAALDADHLLDDERFETIEARRRNDRELVAQLQASIEEAGLRRAELVGRLRDAGVPVAPVNDTERVLADEHLEATDSFARIRAPIADVDGEGEQTRVRVPRSPIASSAFDRVTATDPPGLGEDTRTILESVGYSEEDIDRFEREDVV